MSIDGFPPSDAVIDMSLMSSRRWRCALIAASLAAHLHLIAQPPVSGFWSGIAIEPSSKESDELTFRRWFTPC